MCLNQERQNVVIYGENVFIIVLWLSPISVSEWDILVYFLYMILFWAHFCICLHKNGIISEYFGLFAVYDTILSFFFFDVCSRCRIVSEWYTFGIFPVYCTVLSEFYVFFCVFLPEIEPNLLTSLVWFGSALFIFIFIFIFLFLLLFLWSFSCQIIYIFYCIIKTNFIYVH